MTKGEKAFSRGWGRCRKKKLGPRWGLHGSKGKKKGRRGGDGLPPGNLFGVGKTRKGKEPKKKEPVGKKTKRSQLKSHVGK